MNWWDDNVTPILMQPASAGVAGAILGALNAPGLTIREQFFNLFAGVGAAIYLAPFLAERANINSAHGQLAFAFVVGLLGMNLLSKIIAAGRRADWAVLIDLLSKGRAK